MRRFLKLFFCIAIIILLAACRGNEVTPNTTQPQINPDTSGGGSTHESEAKTENESERDTEAFSAVPQTTQTVNEESGTINNTGEDIQVNSPTTGRTEANTNNNNKTFTGRPPLPLADFKSFDKNNTKGLPTTKIAHAYGVAKDEKPHSISVENQKFFDSKGYKALAYDTKTEDKILYLTFDCGYENGYTAKILDTLKTKGVKAAFFCTLPQMKENPDLISRMINEGHIVGNHSNTHPSFALISRSQMAKELQDFDDYLRSNFGYSAPVFRFPMGEYSESALELVESLGYRSIFWSVAYSDWDLNNQKGGDHALKTVTARLHPGAVILLHSVSPDNSAALGGIIDWAENKGYSFRALL